MSLRRTALGVVIAAVALSAAAAPAEPQLVVLNAARVIVVDADGRNLRTVAQAPPPPAGRRGGSFYDGVAYDPATRQIYWTDMGRPSADDGTVQRVDLAGGEAKMIVPPGGTFTAKQLKLDPVHGKLYWADREGMRIMRANLDGSGIEVLVQTGAGDEDRRDQSRWCVGIALDVARGYIYWTQKGGDNAGEGVIRRAPIALPKGETAATRSDIQTLFAHLPEPIDLDLDLKARRLYWTDRGDNTVSRAPMDPPRGFDPAHRGDREVLVRGLKEAIGIALDLPRGRMFYTSLGGELGTAKLDGSEARLLVTGLRPLAGIALITP